MAYVIVGIGKISSYQSLNTNATWGGGQRVEARGTGVQSKRSERETGTY